MAQILVRTSRFPLAADIASGYTLVFAFYLFRGDPLTHVAEISVVGGLVSSALLIVDPVNKFVRFLFFKNSLNAHRKGYAKWYFQVLARWYSAVLTREGLRNYLLEKAGSAYYSPYLARLRAQLSGGAIFALTILTFSVWVVVTVPYGSLSLPLAAASFVVALVVLYSLRRDIRWRLPEYSWTVGVYYLIIEVEGPQKIEALKIISKHFLDDNWAEARAWIFYQLLHTEKPTKETLERELAPLGELD